VYGQYGGPRWTAGKFDGTDFSVPSINELDEIYREHDYLYGVTTKAKADGYTANRLHDHFLRTGHPTSFFSSILFRIIGEQTTEDFVFPWKVDQPEPHPPDEPYDDDMGFTPL
jgi:hypothetical protein